jgi:two-component system response regulator HydG
VGNLSYEVQIQLLRAIQELRIRPVGATKEIEIDVRIVSATNEDLQVAIERGRFREDLYHRLNEFTLQMPSLRERKEDILLFANHFLDAANKELERNVVGFDKEASQLIQEYHWPGNLRQLKNIVKRATLLAQNKFITANELDIPKESSPNLQLHNRESEKKQIIEALQQAGNNKTKAATLLGVDRKTLYNKIAKYNLE